MFRVRKVGEMYYVHNLNVFTEDHIESRSGMHFVLHAGWVWWE